MCIGISDGEFVGRVADHVTAMSRPPLKLLPSFEKDRAKVIENHNSSNEEE